MGLETRNGRGTYFATSRWVNGRVVREYGGSGWSAVFQALTVQDERDRKAEELARERKEQERLAALDRQVDEVCAVVDVLLRDTLTQAGYHQHDRGAWRRRRV